MAVGVAAGGGGVLLIGFESADPPLGPWIERALAVWAESGGRCPEGPVLRDDGAKLPASLPKWDESRVTDSDEEVVVSHNWSELRHFMWDYVGIVRTNKRLKRAASRIELLLHEIEEYYGNFRITNDLIELRNLAQVARLIVQSATLRRESRGLHYTLDYPEPEARGMPHSTVLVPGNFAGNHLDVKW